MKERRETLPPAPPPRVDVRLQHCQRLEAVPKQLSDGLRVGGALWGPRSAASESP